MEESKNIISRFEDVIIQIATPYSTGTGFYVDAWKLIVTNEHVVSGNRSVVVAGKRFEKQLVDVVFIDARFDVAFLRPPADHSMPSIQIADGSQLREGDKVIAVGHPFDLKFTATQGIVSSLTHQENDVFYVQHDAALNPGNSGGPLLDTEGRVVGINTFIIQNGNSIGFSLPSRYVCESFKVYTEGKGLPGVRCASCHKVTFDKGKTTTKYCENCGAALAMISQTPEYHPQGVCQTIENVIHQLGYDVALSRKGPNSWVLKKGGAVLNFSYYERNGMLLGDAVLCTLPEDHIGPLYTFLLQQNYVMQGTMFSLRDQDIILSIILFDQFIVETALKELMERYLISAAEFDKILVTKFGAKQKPVS